jgi:TPR repeat protein
LAATLIELKERASSGDPSAVNVLGFIALQKCELGRNEEQIESWESLQVRSAESLPAADSAWFDATLKQDDAYDRRFAKACSQLIDKEQISSWVTARSSEGDGASLWLLSRASNNIYDMQQKLRKAAEAGFPQAEFELARAILGGQSGAGGSGSAPISAVALLKQSAAQLPDAEANLAICEYSGCEGIAPDIDSSLAHARDAAQKGTIDAIVALAPHLPTGQLNPEEASAWSQVQAALQQSGCSVSSFSVKWMQASSAARASNNSAAQSLADQIWRAYGNQMLANLGCRL